MKLHCSQCSDQFCLISYLARVMPEHMLRLQSGSFDAPNLPRGSPGLDGP